MASYVRSVSKIAARGTQFVLLIVIVLWLSAQTREEAIRRAPEREIPENVEYVIFDKGRTIHWRLGTVRDNPFAFLACLALVGVIEVSSRRMRLGPAAEQAVDAAAPD